MSYKVTNDESDREIHCPGPENICLDTKDQLFSLIIEGAMMYFCDKVVVQPSFGCDRMIIPAIYTFLLS